MNRYSFLIITMFLFTFSMAQAQKKKDKSFTPKESTPPSTATTAQKDIPAPVAAPVERTSDHFMFQFGYDGWTSRPDSVNTGGFSRHFNTYFMVDKPFKTSPNFSYAYGGGIGTSNIFFNNTYVDLKSNGPTLPFTDQSTTSHYNKFKVVNLFFEIPVELRYYSNPTKPNNSWKVALGVKAGYLLKAYSKAKNLLNADGSSAFGASYVIKESDSKFFNSYKLAGTMRIGFGNFSIHGDFAVTPVLKDGMGPSMYPYAIGVAFSGL